MEYVLINPTLLYHILHSQPCLPTLIIKQGAHSPSMLCNFYRCLRRTADGWSISHLGTLPAKSTSVPCNRHSSTHRSNLPTEQLRQGTLTPNSATQREIFHTYIAKPWHLLSLPRDELCDHPRARRQWPAQLVITSSEPAGQTQAHSSAICPAFPFLPPVFNRTLWETRQEEQGNQLRALSRDRCR